MARLTIRLTRTSPTHHRFAFTRPDGSGESRELETRSCLFHDLLHFALETEVGLRRSFYGLLAGGAPYEQLAMAADGEILATERIVGILTGTLRHEATPEQFAAITASAFAAHGDPLPAWCNAGLVDRVRERMRRLEGHWRATPFGRPMELHFDLDEQGPAGR